MEANAFTAGRAIRNARTAAGSLAARISERAQLAPSESDELVAEHGALTRLSREECLRLLRSRRVGRYAYVANARALDVVPVNYIVRADGTIVFRTGVGPKLSSAERRDVVAFQVDEIDEATATGWSVLVTGRAGRLPWERAGAREPLPWVNGPRHHLVVVTPSHIEGRRLH